MPSRFTRTTPTRPASPATLPAGGGIKQALSFPREVFSPEHRAARSVCAFGCPRARGTPGTSSPHGPVSRKLERHRRSCRKGPVVFRHPARGVRGLLHAIPGGLTDLSSAGGTPHRHLRGWDHASARPGGPCDERRCSPEPRGLDRLGWVRYAHSKATATHPTSKERSRDAPREGWDGWNVVLR